MPTEPIKGHVTVFDVDGKKLFEGEAELTSDGLPVESVNVSKGVMELQDLLLEMGQAWPECQFKDLMASKFLAGFPGIPCDNKIKLAKELPFPNFHFNPQRMATEPGETEYLSEKVMAIFLDGPAKDIFVWIPSAAGRAYEVFDLAPKQTIYKADPRSPKGLLFYRLHRID